MDNNKLELFGEQINDLLIKNPNWNIKLSGVAKIITLDNKIIFSASLYIENYKNDNIPKPYDYDYIFKNENNKLPDFIYNTIEILTFKSNTNLPNPQWRIQVKYL
ncbi:hypothetical protein AMV018 [Betaentomopoxvirus amoorei]|uniref:AMV018 n=1 Tax=Amsacta moorei entomopoxvirus TaxID=28321 RepID=Q9EN30_AMEPV|nr:hypothetical protein AMV018 [Amsacta moorei entomopoxvirus]AAG02724.1 AMV018 [Amsacta moorei entomopoxvirus]